jgi:hypothetical protein
VAVSASSSAPAAFETAKTLGLDVPSSPLGRADEVIE